MLQTFSVKFVLLLIAVVPDKESSLLHVVNSIGYGGPNIH